MLHFIPFLAGAAAGAAITYIVKDREARDRIREGADQVADGVRSGFDRTARAAQALAGRGSVSVHQDISADDPPTDR